MRQLEAKISKALPSRASDLRYLRHASALRLHRRVAVAIAATDAIIIACAYMVAGVVRFGLSEWPAEAGVVVVVAPLAWTTIFVAYRLYGVPRYSPAEELRRLLLAMSTGIATMSLVIFLAGWEIPRLWLGSSWILSAALVILARRMWHFWMGRAKSRGDLAIRTLIVGGNKEASSIAEALRSRLDVHGFQPIGFALAGRDATARGEAPTGLPILGSLADLPHIIRERGIECLFLPASGLTDEDTNSVMQMATSLGLEVRVSANVQNLLGSRLAFQPVGNVVALSLRPVQLGGPQVVVKRIFDVAVAGLAAILTLPLWLGCALALKLDSRGPLIFRQSRVTKGGRKFGMLKFRTMVQNAGEVLASLEVEPAALFFKLQDDPRLTRVGRVLRRWSLDELPQLWNVIKGDMSLVGPRPLPVEQVEAAGDSIAPRHQVPAGLTGWWQIQGRSTIRAEDALSLDLFYIENWSLTLDMYILAKTLGVILRGEGAF